MKAAVRCFLSGAAQVNALPRVPCLSTGAREWQPHSCQVSPWPEHLCWFRCTGQCLGLSLEMLISLVGRAEEPGWESWGCPAWTGKGSGET